MENIKESIENLKKEAKNREVKKYKPKIFKLTKKSFVLMVKKSTGQVIGQGAEAIIYQQNNQVIKDRVKKDYRIKEIDEPLRSFRTKREAKVLEKLSLIGFPAPEIIRKDKTELKMQFIPGQKLRDVLSDKKADLKWCEKIGELVGVMHTNHIIHGDLTTSNMILHKDKKELYFIDFGLSFFSHKIEDKAVDVHLFRQALESAHHEIFEKGFKLFVKGYEKSYAEAKEIWKRLEVVEKRGRYKKKH